MSSNQPMKNKGTGPEDVEPWYKQFWPWFIIALPASAVIASFITLWLAVSNPVHIVVSEEEYQQLRGELKAQAAAEDKEEAEAGESDPELN